MRRRVCNEGRKGGGAYQTPEYSRPGPSVFTSCMCTALSFMDAKSDIAIKQHGDRASSCSTFALARTSLSSASTLRAGGGASPASCLRRPRVCCRVFIVISGYVASRATMPPPAPDAARAAVRPASDMPVECLHAVHRRGV